MTKFEEVAIVSCRDLLKLVYESFYPPNAIEAMVILAFTRGAAWALDVDIEAARTPKS